MLNVAAQLKQHYLNETWGGLSALELLDLIHGFMVEQSSGLISKWTRLPPEMMTQVEKHCLEDSAYSLRLKRDLFSYHTKLNINEDTHWVYDSKEDLYKSQFYSDLTFRTKAGRY